MRNTVILVVLGTSFLMGSCKKTHSCVCTDSFGEVALTESAKAKKKDAEASCSSYEASYDYDCTFTPG